MSDFPQNARNDLRDLLTDLRQELDSLVRHGGHRSKTKPQVDGLPVTGSRSQGVDETAATVANLSQKPCPGCQEYYCGQCCADDEAMD